MIKKTLFFLKELEVNFRRWDIDGDLLVNPDDLENYMADPPTNAQLSPYDNDGNGLYSIAELAAATRIAMPEHGTILNC